MTHALQIIQAAPAHATPEVAAQVMRSSRVFSAQLPADQSEASAVWEAIAYLAKPAPRNWVAGRVATLLSHYYQAATDENLMAAIADDWCDMLEEYPAWAIANACRWWMSRENARKHIKPLPGDIQERAHIETDRVRAAEITLRRGIIAAQPDTSRNSPTPEEVKHRRAVAAEVMANFTNRSAAQ